MRILVTNDDGVSAPGLAALTRALVRWTKDAGGDGPGRPTRSSSSRRAPTTAAPAPRSGSVTDGTAIPYQRAFVEGAEGVEAYGLDASPALSVIAGALGAVGPKPDLVLSGINHGVNVGRSVLHSGTVGAALTASQLGISALAVSLRVGRRPRPVGVGGRPRRGPHPPARRGAAAHGAQPERAPPSAGRDPRRALGPGERRRADQVRPRRGAATWEAPNPEEMEGPAAAEAARAVMEGEPGGEGRDRADRRVAVPPLGRPRAADAGAEDATLVAQGYAALTALRGPRAEDDPELLAQIDGGLGRRASRRFGFTG